VKAKKKRKKRRKKEKREAQARQEKVYIFSLLPPEKRTPKTGEILHGKLRTFSRGSGKFLEKVKKKLRGSGLKLCNFARPFFRGENGLSSREFGRLFSVKKAFLAPLCVQFVSLP
jgi:hypothetical protein